MGPEIRGVRWLLLSLALQNLGRRKARSLLLIAAVAIGSAVVFTGATLMQSIDRSMSVGFTRMGADMMVVPEGALTNITAALLVVEPTELVLDADALAKANLASVGRFAAQKIVRVEHSGIGAHHDSVDLIGFDPVRDFTIQPWLAERINRADAAGRRDPGRRTRCAVGLATADLRQAAHRLWPAGPHRRRHPRARRVHAVRDARGPGRRDPRSEAALRPPCWRRAR